MTSRGKTRSKPPRPTFDDTRRLTAVQEVALFAFLMIVLLVLVIYGLRA